MKLSTRTHYGTRALLELALHQGEMNRVLEATTLQDLVERQKKAGK